MDGSGHRSRLRRRLFEGGPDALLDHELVEYLLALALPRRDTKDLAKRLIAEFGGFGGLLSADGEAIMRLGGVSEGTAAAIKIAQAAALRLLESQVKERPVLGSWQALLDYLHADMAHHPVERVRVLYLNRKQAVIAASKYAPFQCVSWRQNVLQSFEEHTNRVLIGVYSSRRGISACSSKDEWKLDIKRRR